MKANTHQFRTSCAAAPARTGGQTLELQRGWLPCRAKLGLQLAVGLALTVSLVFLQAAGPETSASCPAKTIPGNSSIPWSDLGARATAQYAGDGLAVSAAEDGAVRLRCAFQRLEGEVTSEGLWLTSTVEDAAADRFRVVADYLGRDGGAMVALPESGLATHEAGVARYVRRGLVEEYSVSVDGVRQDFLVAEPPGGNGPLRVDLAVTGARAEAAASGVRLVLDNSGRKLVYSRLRVKDAAERALSARMDVVSSDRLAVVVEDAGAVYPVRIDPTFSDENWVSMGGILGTDGEVSAAISDAVGNLYIGGKFTMVADVLATNIAKWNGSTWSTLGSLGSGVGDAVYALAVSGTNLYAGGYFTSAGGVPASSVAKWNGNTWSALGSGVNGSVYALAVSGSDLYAGGYFTTAGGASAKYIAKWNGSAWSALGSGMNDSVKALAVSGSDLYAGGWFRTAGGVSANFVAKWNGSTWSALGTGMEPGMGGNVSALAVSGTDLYAGGYFTSAGGVPASSVAKWNGNAWSALGSGVGGSVYAMALSGADLYAGGAFTTAGGTPANYIAKWNGSTWSALGAGASGAEYPYVFTLALQGTDLYVGGKFETAGGVPANYIAKWNGSAWSALGSGMNGEVAALAVSGTDLYAGGDFSWAGGVAANYVAKWNGSTWTALGSGMNGEVAALAVSGTNLYAGGYFTSAGGVPASSVAKWNGNTWSALGSGVNGSVYALAVSGSDLYAGGWFSTAGGVAANYVAKWNGSTWTALGSGLDNGVAALAVSGTDLYAGGNFTTAGGASAKYIAKWNGSAWSALGSGMNNNVKALAVSGSDLYAGGWFSTAGGVSANHVAKWNGSTWSALDSGVSDIVYALALSSTDLYAGGPFKKAGGTSANYIAKWNGSTWSALGSGMNRTVCALAASGTNLLYVGGSFERAGGKVSAYVAKAMLAGTSQNQPPSITSQPQSRTNVAGSTATFLVTAVGTEPLSYRWLKDGVDLTDGGNVSGAKTATLTLANVQIPDAGDYTVVVSNAYGSVTSQAARLTVIACTPPVITLQPVSQTKCAGEPVAFSVAVTGIDLTYQWRKDGVNISGATNSTYTIQSVAAGDAGSYDCLIDSACGPPLTSGNLLANPGFEEGTTGWFVLGSASFTAVTSPVHSGSRAAYVQGRTDTWNGPAQGLLGVLQPSTSYYIGAWLRVSGSANQPVTLTIKQVDGAGTVYKNIASTTIAPGQWKRLVGGFTLNVTGTLTELVLYAEGPAAGVNLYADDFVIVPMVGSGLNLVQNPGFEQGTSGWYALGATSLTASGSQAHSGAASGYVQGRTATWNGVAQWMLGVLQPETIYRMSVWVRLQNADNQNVSLTIGQTDDSGSRWWHASGTASSTGWTRLMGEFALHTFGTLTELQLFVEGPNAGVNFYADDCVVEPMIEATGEGCRPATLTVNSPPQITSQPTGATRDVGQSVTFSVTATGSGLTYQWRKGGENIAGATGPFYQIQAVALPDAGDYDCVVSGVCGSPVTSQVATLTVNQPGVPPSITAQPQSRTNLAGTTASFAVTATGSTPLGYRWRKDGANLADGGNLSGATNTVLTLVNVQGEDAGDYQVVVTNAYGSVTSAVAVLTVTTCAPPAVTTPPIPLVGQVGASVTMSFAATGTEPLSYQWYLNGTNNLAGATNTSLTLTNIQPADAGYYEVVVTNACGSTTGLVASLTVPQPGVAPSITAQPQSRTNVAGTAATFSVAATGTAPLRYQWRFEGANLVGATSTNLTFASVQLTNAGNYTVVVTNAYGAVTSQVAVLTVLPDVSPPAITRQPRSRTNAVGTTASFSVGVTGSAPLAYQWRLGDTNLGSATNSKLTLPGVQFANAGNYTVVVTNAYGSVTSAVAVLTVSSAAPSQGWVVAWGDNAYGQTNVPAGLSNAVAVAAGSEHSLALRYDGTVAAWGGRASTTNVPAELNDAVAIAAGDFHSLALLADSTVTAWGSDWDGTVNVPAGLGDVVAIAAGGFHSLALKADGTVVGWGDNEYGQANVPAGLSNVIGIAAGVWHSLALRADGTVVGWGGFPPEGAEARVPTGLSNVVAIAAGGKSMWAAWSCYSLALRADGTVVAWGDATVPVGLDGVSALAAGGWHCLVSRTNDTLFAWGNNESGQSNVPCGLTNIIAIAAGGLHSLAVVGGVGPCSTRPSITSEPQSRTNVAGTTATFSVTATGTEPLIYQWRKGGVGLTDGGNVSGATTPNLTLTNVQLTDAGDYTVTVSNIAGSVTSQVARLTVQVCVSPMITAQPLGATKCVGESVTFSVTATGTDLAYQWHKDGTALGGATSSSYTISAVAPGHAGNFYCVVSGACGEPVTSQPATLTVNSPPAITGQPSAATRNVGESVTFLVTATGSGLTYQWRKGGVNIGGATWSTYTIPSVAMADAGNYDCVVSGVCGAPVTSQVATLTVNQPALAPSITAQPQSRTNVAGTTSTFCVTATGTPPLTYQWLKDGLALTDGGNVSGATTTCLTLTGVQPADAGGYMVLVTNLTGSVTSQVATLTVGLVAPGTLRWVSEGLDLLDGSSPAIGQDGTIYIGGHNGVYALDGASGTQRWYYTVGAGIRCSPVLGADETVYIGGCNDRVYALNPTNGQPRWIIVPGGCFDGTPALGADGTVFIGSGGLPSDDPRRWKFYALNGVTGQTRWQFQAGGDLASPVIGADGTVYVGTLWENKLRALDSLTGAQRWEFTAGNHLISSPALGADGTLYVGSVDGKMYALDSATGAKKWEFAAGTIVSSPTLGADGTLYVGADDGKLYALHPLMGAKRWEFTAGNSIAGVPAVGADGVVYVGSSDNKFYALNGETGAKLWEFSTGGAIASCPAVGPDGTVYFTSADRKIYALWTTSVGGLANSPWPMFHQNVRHTGRAEGLPLWPPAIILHPHSRTNAIGTPARFTVTALGTAPLTYQWRKNGNNLSDGGNISGAATATLDLTAVKFADAGEYSVVVANAAGSATSEVAMLAVIPAVPRAEGVVVAWGQNNWGQTAVPEGLSNVVAMAAGSTHNLALKSDGTVVGWGAANFGKTTPPAGLSNVVAVAAGDSHSLALKYDGTVAGWGNNGSGQTNPPPGLADVVAIAAGYDHSLALTGNGMVVAWGGSPLFGQTNIPSGASNVVAISAGQYVSLALRGDGTIVAWGYSPNGEANVPASATNVVAISAGRFHCLALKRDGTVVAWGSNGYGQTNVPASLSNVVAIAGGAYHSLALQADGTLVGWGWNQSGQTTIPAELGHADVLAIAARGNHSLALKRQAGLAIAPAITLQPQSRTNAAGTTATFTVGAIGTAPLSYEWRKDGTRLVNGGTISGATSPVLTLASIQTNDVGAYEVVVANAFGSVTSQVATLTLTPATPGNVRWQFLAGDIVASSPAIGADGTVYVGSWNGKFYALDGATGAKRWEFQAGAILHSSPTIGTDGTVYFGSYEPDSKVYALNGATGAKRWQFTTGNRVASSPAIGMDGTVYVGSQDGRLYALDGVTGQQRWAFQTAGEVNSSPAIGADGTVYVGSLDQKLYALNGATGAKRWEFLTAGQIHSSPAIGADGTVYVGCYDRKVYAVNGATGQLRWTYTTGRYIWCGPTVGPDGTVYIGSHDGNVYALDGATGQRRWVTCTGGYVGTSPAIGVDGVLYVGSGPGAKLFALDSATGQKLWEFRAGADVSSSVAIGPDGTLYFGSHDGHVYALHSTSVGGLVESPWPMFHQNARHTGRAGAVLPTAPIIVRQPASLTVPLGASATFGVIVSGAAPLAYQWCFNDATLPLATNANFTLPSASLADAGNYHVIVTNALGSITSQVATLAVSFSGGSLSIAGTGHDGYVAGGIVFFDANRNGQLDLNEPSVPTDEKGQFELSVPLDEFDANHNGRLDPAEGCFVLGGGLDIATGQPLRTALTAPAGATVVNPLTTLLQELLDQTPGLSISNAQESLRTALGVSNRVDLASYDPFAAVRTNDPLAGPVLRASAQVQDTTVQIAALLEGASPTQGAEQLAQHVTAVLAAQVRGNNLALDLGAPAQIETLLTQAVSLAALSLPANTTEGAAQIIAEGNQLKAQAVASATDGLTAAEEVSRIQGLAQGSIADDLALVGAHAKVIDDAVAASTGSALQTQVDAAPVGDVTGAETRVGTFAFSRPEFRVLEDGTSLIAVTVNRTDGNKGPVGLRIALSDGTARFADGDYAGTSVYLQFGDGEISQTVNFGAVLNDDAEVESDETLVLTLSLQSGAPPQAQIGIQNQAVLTVVDNDSPGTFAFSQAHYQVREDGTAVSAVRIRRDGGSAGVVSLIVTPTEIPGGATAHADFDPAPVTVTFLPGNMNRIVNIPVLADGLLETDEALQLNLTLAAGAPSGAALGAQATATLTILDSTVVPPVIQLNILPPGPGGEFKFNVTGTPGRTCKVQQSSNLVDWADLSQHTLTATPVVVTGAQMQSTSQRFYRAVLLP
jgi:outer membrane protein assembly factor BamB